ncbi:hypothetical protein GCM10025869_02260 [Homoserinibacter gongjuensis]|uniref:Uncharacterized protein n=1 Tax=Homoserinibacter gongjuensis TaxID=1162968 RepID=A0ABQ6JN30_9MICO|nr:hypothetical protein GCM10025869_02260 [Homoserinibacter gongjuensis]
MRASFSAACPFEMVHSTGSAGFTMRQPIEVFHIVGLPDAGHGLGDFSTTKGARLIDSTPPASTRLASPVSIAREPWMTASTAEPHSRLTVTPGTLVGKPASSAPKRATSRLSSPAWLASPKTMSSMRAGSRPVRSTLARMTTAARSSGRTPASAPPARPKGVRTAS